MPAWAVTSRPSIRSSGWRACAITSLTLGNSGKLRIIAYITDSLAITQILDHLGLWPAEENKPPPAPREIHAVPVDDEGRDIAEAG
jgi:hypothetical protein